MIEGISCQTRSPMRSIVSLCEQSGYRSFGEKFTNQNAFLLAYIFSEEISRQTKKRVRSIVDLCEELAY